MTNSNSKKDKDIFDLAIVGGGPIGASTAYFLPAKTLKRTLLITQEPSDDKNHDSTYKYAGGSVRWYWDDPLKLKMTRTTADFIKGLLKKGVDLSAIEDNYLFMTVGAFAPSLNVAGAKLVNYLLSEASKKGLTLKQSTILKKINLDGHFYKLDTTDGSFVAKKVLLAVGPNTKKWLPKAKINLEKRVLLVLNIKIDEDRTDFPHLVVPLEKGVIYVFIKKIDGEYKMVLGQEDVVKHNDRKSPENYLPQLKKKGLLKIMPFLKEAQVEKILWGFDPDNKTLEIYTEDHRLFAAYCGSAVRSCIYIGQKLAQKLVTK